MSKTIIHVNKFIIGNNNKCGLNNPAIIVRNYKKRINAATVEIEGPSKIIHSQNKPLSGCGAKIWIETYSKVYADGKEF